MRRAAGMPEGEDRSVVSGQSFVPLSLTGAVGITITPNAPSGRGDDGEFQLDLSDE